MSAGSNPSVFDPPGILGKIHVGPRSYRRAAGGGAVWVPSYMGRAVYRIQPRG